MPAQECLDQLLIGGIQHCRSGPTHPGHLDGESKQREAVAIRLLERQFSQCLEIEFRELRRPPLGAVLATAHDMGREHKIISGVGLTDVPMTLDGEVNILVDKSDENLNPAGIIKSWAFEPQPDTYREFTVAQP